jgi:hypothetical protein
MKRPMGMTHLRYVTFSYSAYVLRDLDVIHGSNLSHVQRQWFREVRSERLALPVSYRRRS